MDSILLIGNVDPKLTAFMTKAGYKLHTKSDSKSIPELVRDEFIDIALIEDTKDKQIHEWIEFLRSQEQTRDIPIVALAADKLQTLQIRELSFDKIEVMQHPFSLGTIVSKLATLLRLRKMSGRNEEKASLAEVNAALRDMNERHTRELQDARNIQKALLPKELPSDETFEVSVAYDPLEEVGGDFYTVQKTVGGGVQLLSTDVTGHGLSAAFIGSMTKLALVAVAKESPGELLKGMNELMAPVLPQGRFVTANAYLYHPEEKKLYFARAGGPQAALLRLQTREILELKGDGFPLGFFEEGEYPTDSTPMESGDILVVVTDGVTEAQNRKKEFFGFEGITKVLETVTAEHSSQNILETIQKTFKSFLDGRILKDDVTILVLRAK
jgi:serine phosphatase RsbU (regulator of sigma subunit)